MIKAFTSESIKLAYLGKRVILLFTRFRGIPPNEPAGVDISFKKEQRGFIKNDVEAFQDGSKVSLCASNLQDFRICGSPEKQRQLHC